MTACALNRRFRLTPVKEAPPVPAVPAPISRLGIKAEQYGRSLMKLAAGGCREAQVALSGLQDFVQELVKQTPLNALRTLEKAGVAPVDLFPSARWVIDAGGLVALELLLWLWCARATPHDYGSPYGDVAAGLEPFDEDSADDWWALAWDALLRTYPHPEATPELKPLIKAQSCKNSSVKGRNYLLRKLKKNFISFAPPEAKSTGAGRLVVDNKTT